MELPRDTAVCRIALSVSFARVGNEHLPQLDFFGRISSGNNLR